MLFAFELWHAGYYQDTNLCIHVATSSEWNFWVKSRVSMMGRDGGLIAVKRALCTCSKTALTLFARVLPYPFQSSPLFSLQAVYINYINFDRDTRSPEFSCFGE